MFSALYFQFDCNKAGQCTVIEQQINEEIRVADLNAVFFANKSEIMSKLYNEVFQMRDNLTPQVLFFVRFLKFEKFKHIGIAQSRKSAVPGKQILVLFVRDHRPLIQHTADLTIQFAFCVTVCNA